MRTLLVIIVVLAFCVSCSSTGQLQMPFFHNSSQDAATNAANASNNAGNAAAAHQHHHMPAAMPGF